MLDFKPADCQVHLDLSYNNIDRMEDLSKQQYLKYLSQAHNNITQINGITKNSTLKWLDLSYNSIEMIENLDEQNLTELNLDGNKIFLLTNLMKLKKQRQLSLAKNKIRKLDELQSLGALRFQDLSSNEIKKIKELDRQSSLPYQTKLDLCHNSCQTLKLYRLRVIYKLSQLRELDGVQITPKEVVKSEIFYGMSYP